MKLEDFEKLKQIAVEDTKLPDTLKEIMKINNLLPATIQRWTTLYTKQRFIVATLKTQVNEVYGEKFKFYKFDDNYSWSTTKEVESQINRDPAYLAILKEHDTQKYILDFIEETVNNIKNLGFTIKNYIDYQKMLYTTGT